MEASSSREFEDREAVARRSRVMWVVISTLGMAMLGLVALGALRDPSGRMKQYGVELNQHPYKPQLAEKMPQPLKDPARRPKAKHHHDDKQQLGKKKVAKAAAAQKAAAAVAAPPKKAHFDDGISYTTEALADEITSLPGLTSTISFRHFSGYLQISETKFMFYWYVESEQSPTTAPLVLWTNGGPGCSGLFGFLTENGPFRPTKDGESVSLNDYAWNKVANMLFIEAPVGVGFSYSSDPSKDYVMGDAQTAADNYLLVQTFLSRFPHLRSNDFYLTSESYGGHYLPTLAKVIVEKNAEGKGETINLKGFMVGNPFTDPVENVLGMFDTFWGHQMVPEDLYMSWKENCGSSMDLKTYSTSTCTGLQNEMWYLIGDVDPYALDYPVCTESFDTKSAGISASKHLAHHAGRNQRHKLLMHSLSRFIAQDPTRPSYNRLKKGTDFEACEEAYATLYMNRADVKAAVHAESSIDWVDCSSSISYQYEDEDNYMEPIYKYFVEEDKSLRILVYSGDDDSVCATRGTQMWIDSMKWTATQDWSPWTYDSQVAGYMKKYDNGFTFATVHGAGHEVPTYKPEAALQLFVNYLGDKL